MLNLTRRSEQYRDDSEIVVEAGIGLTLCAFLGTACLFFTGLVILNLNSLPFVVQLPVIYLVVSAVAFIISAVIYSNVSGANEQFISRSSMIQMANWTSEYPGIYLFLIAIPLIILGVTQNAFVQYATAVSCYGGLLLYSTSHFSLDHRRFSSRVSRTVNTLLLAVFSIGVYLVAIFSIQYLLPIGIFGLVIILAVSYFSSSNENSSK